MTTTIASALTTHDLARLAATIALVNANDTDSALAAALPFLNDAQRAAVADHAHLAHAGLLVFPRTLEGLGEELSSHGIEVGPMTPSTVVRDRISRRYGVQATDLTIGILRAQLSDRAGGLCELEIFAMATPPELSHIAIEERLHGGENHFALAVPDADPIILSGLGAVIGAHMRPDGGGYNVHEDSTVLYFRNAHHPTPAFRRIELNCAGRFPELLAAHQRESMPDITLLRLMTGAWATQAIATAVELRLPDHLVRITDLPRLAAATDTDQESLGRLLRYLDTLGIVRVSPAGTTLTDLGSRLRSDVEGTLRPLALMYGGPFYQSFAALTDAVRTGEESYAKVFGAHHFAHMAGNPELAELFHESMAASSSIFAEATRVVDFAAARTVVDIAGGNGELLSRILDANPTVHGVLVEQPHALAAAEPTFAHLADRCTLIPGDFTEAVPTTGDIYLLSRVLHDWDDTKCHTILTACAANLPDHAELLVIERLLPEDTDADSLAIPWDIHMLCNVGGRERTESHYRALLARSGFDITAVQPLPLDAYMLRARKTR